MTASPPISRPYLKLIDWPKGAESRREQSRQAGFSIAELIEPERAAAQDQVEV
jgi:hypothetical protein